MNSQVPIENGAWFIGNNALDGSGGGIYWQGAISSTLHGAVFKSNGAVQGGGIALLSSGSLLTTDNDDFSRPVLFTACIFEGNSADNGAGIYNIAGTIEIRYSTFLGNIAGMIGTETGDTRMPYSNRSRTEPSVLDPYHLLPSLSPSPYMVRWATIE